MAQKSLFSNLVLVILTTALLIGCRSVRPPAASPEHKDIQMQEIPQETITASYYQTRAAQFLTQATAEATTDLSGSDNFPYAACVISTLVVAMVVGIYTRSRRMK